MCCDDIVIDINDINLQCYSILIGSINDIGKW